MSDKVQPETSAECSLRDRYARALFLHEHPSKAASKAASWDSGLTQRAEWLMRADAVLAVRDDVLAEKDAEIARLRVERGRLSERAMAATAAADIAVAAGAEVARLRGLWRSTQNVNYLRLKIREQWPDLAAALGDWAPRPSASEAPRTRDGEQGGER